MPLMMATLLVKEMQAQHILEHRTGGLVCLQALAKILQAQLQLWMMTRKVLPT